MASLSQKLEYFIGWSLTSIRHHDNKLFTKTQPFNQRPEPIITVISPEYESQEKELQLRHTPMGDNVFPHLKWEILDAERDRGKESIVEYLVVVEDPDAPLPMPVVHGIYYGIPQSKTSLSPENFKPSPEGNGLLSGGFKFGRNRMKNIWGGPKPVIGHGQHRYMFQIVGLRSALDEDTLGEMPTRADFEKAIVNKVVAWGVWIGTYERNLP